MNLKVEHYGNIFGKTEVKDIVTHQIKNVSQENT